jgi:hypothetical protein
MLRLLVFEIIDYQIFFVMYFRNTPMKKDVVGNVIRVVMLLYLTKQHVLLVQLVLVLMLSKQVIK